MYFSGSPYTYRVNCIYFKQGKGITQKQFKNLVHIKKGIKELHFKVKTQPFYISQIEYILLFENVQRSTRRGCYYRLIVVSEEHDNDAQHSTICVRSLN